MGVLFSRLKIMNKTKSISYPTTNKKYSWERNRLSRDDFVVQKLCNEEEYKLPGAVNGEQIVIQNCTNSKIYVLDFINTVTIDECVDCHIILGPIKRSIFVRDCCNCTVVVACEQFRIRDCSNLNIFLYCATQPIIESSTDIQFACYQLSYQHIKDHFQQCNLNMWNNTWFKIHDYTPPNCNDMSNWRYSKPKNYILPGLTSELSDKYQVSHDPINSIVPLTLGEIPKVNDTYDNCLVVFCDEFSAVSFLNYLIESKENVKLIRSRQLNMSAQHAESLFLTSTLIKAAQFGPVIGLHMFGESSLNICLKTIQEKTETQLYYISPNSNMASHQVNTFFGIADLQTE